MIFGGVLINFMYRITGGILINMYLRDKTSNDSFYNLTYRLIEPGKT